MSYQNIFQYPYKKLYLKNVSEIMDICLSSDERDYDQEVVFSPYIIGYDDGNVLPIQIDLNNTESNQKLPLTFNNYNQNNIILSKNYYNPNFDDLLCYSSKTLCDIGLVGTDNGLVDQMTGETISFTMGLLPNNQKFNRLDYDRRFKMFQVYSYVKQPNLRFSGIPFETNYSIVSKNDPNVGYYNELYGSFYQGFYQLFGYNYEVFPERVQKGWSVDLLLKPRLTNEYQPLPYQTWLNNVYPNNSNTFFYFGTRAENKYYHYSNDIFSSSTTGEQFTSVTSNLGSCLFTCGCSDTGNTLSYCLPVYPPSSVTVNYDPCSGNYDSVPNPVQPPYWDSISNSMSFRFSGDPKNPKICVRVLRFYDECQVTGTSINGHLCDTGSTYVTGYTVDEYCSPLGINYYCEGTDYVDKEHWVYLSFVFERPTTYDVCELLYRGGLGPVVRYEYSASLYNNSVSLIEPPVTNGEEDPYELPVVQLNEEWLDELSYRLGKLKVYLNGRLFFIIDNFEEVIPRPLNTEREKQIGVPFNISWGGGTQGLRENLVFSGCPTGLTNNYIQDPQLFPDSVLNGTSYDGVDTGILIEKYFAGTFDGGISQFGFYTIPMTPDQIKHNYLIYKDRYSLFDWDCPECVRIIPTPTPPPTQTPVPTPTPTPTPTPSPLDIAYLFVEPTTGSTMIGEWMFNGGSNFFGFTNASQPSQNQPDFQTDMTRYLNYTGWTNGVFPQVIPQLVPQNSGGVDSFGNPIVSYNFLTTKVPKGYAGGNAWYTWIIPVSSTNNERQTIIDLNINDNPNLLTGVGTEPTINTFVFTYTGNTIPQNTYRVYTTFPNTIFEIMDTQNIYFRGNTISP